ncbi:MAG TPA: IclR family transcriptional regulator [Ktedonobacterales bacterium]|nr:IclR family transcriptional regulator [Ktedonobacterales bacterium]
MAAEISNEEHLRESSSSQLIGSVSKALDILDVFTPQKPELSLTELAARLSLNKSTLFGLLRTLEHHGYIAQSAQTKRYRLGLRLVDRGALVLDYADVSRISPPFLDELRDQVEENVHLGVLDDGEVVYLYRAQGPHSLSVNSRPGGRAPVHCTAMGKAMLAFISDADVDLILQRRGLAASTPNTITNAQAFRQCLVEVREQGYAVDAEEHHIGSQCIAAPIFDMRGDVVAAISVSVPAVRMGGARRSHIVQCVKSYAEVISKELGWRSRQDVREYEPESSPTPLIQREHHEK